MKKIFALLALIGTLSLSAQEIGVRFGEISGENKVAVDAIFELGEFSRVHGNISFGSGVGVDALWDFLYKPFGEDNFYWYTGVGPSLYFADNIFLLGVSGEIGIEYVFDGAPIAIGLDYRPTFWIVESTSFDWGGFGLNVRYRF